jgi:hypothetical protein
MMVLLLASVAWMALAGRSPVSNPSAPDALATGLSVDGIHLGMTKSEVRLRLGEPEGATQAHAASTPSVWHKEETTVTFDTHSHVNWIGRTIRSDTQGALNSMSLLANRISFGAVPLVSDASLASTLGPQTRQSRTPQDAQFVDLIWDVGSVHVCVGHRCYSTPHQPHETTVVLSYRPVPPPRATFQPWWGI